MTPTTLLCPHCGETTSDAAKFCEGCGKPLQTPEPALAPRAAGCPCGGNIDAEGFCTGCGRKGPDPRDHVEQAIGADLAAVTDRGIRHRLNEDDFAIGVNARGSALVVCDGVSSASNSNVASRIAARAARDEMLLALEAGEESVRAVARAVLKAHRAASKVPKGEDGKSEPPGATIVAAVVVGLSVAIGWAGDSRAYWLGRDGASQLTEDHSWLTETVESGAMTEEEAAKDPRAHAITQCIGPLNEGPPEPGIATFSIDEPGYLLLCTDGLWGYAPSAEELRGMLVAASPLENARLFVEFALRKGGVDNITAVLLRISPPQ